MAKSIQITTDLFFDICDYFFKQADDISADEIRYQLNQKIDKLINHDLFSRYKTAPTGAEREKARQEYLERRGIPRSFRTDIEQDPSKLISQEEVDEKFGFSNQDLQGFEKVEFE